MPRCLSQSVSSLQSLLASVALFAWLGTANCLHAQEASPAAPGRLVPTLESLPHVALPKGFFKGWCGKNDRYLLDVNGQFEAHDAGGKFATIAVSTSWPWSIRGFRHFLLWATRP